MNFYGEGFINFGVIGVVLFSLALAFIYSYFERNCFNTPSNRIFYYFLIGSLFYVFRGDLLSPFAYMVGTFCSVYFVRLLIIKHVPKAIYRS